ncbi:MAG: amino acid permease [Dehalococcoidia bacterium]|uniref:APC family permease n=1 Tax=Candidatus Amarobacter glycogenicus TaxID=3140699 RepID=UPI00313647CD|nr:amino acid permease [Dehalococcoidia bacterium]MBK6560550.1 amino acid permease [Dehalococcoidia bacterium]MCC6267158.1 amino acid permease [Dehalococcoidia bacterium]
MPDKTPALSPSLSPLQVTAGGVGIIIGAGIYVLIGEATAEAGSLVWASFLLAAALCVLTGLSYAELSAAFPSVASEYDYSRRAFPEWVAFLVGWVMIAGLIAAAATVSLGFAQYAREFVDIGLKPGALLLLAGLLVLSATGIRQAGLLILVLSTIQVAGLLAVIALGLPSLGDHSLTVSGSAGGVIGGAALVFFAFIGFDEVITLSEETPDPVRTVPRALLVALGISTVLYVFTAVAAVSTIGADALANSERPLAAVVATAAGERSGDIIAVAALVSTTNTTLLALTAASRMTYGMANQGAFPRWLGGVSRATRVPLRSLVVVSAVAAGMVVVGELGLLAQVTDFSVYLVFFAVNGAVIVLRFRQPATSRPFRTPWAAGKLPLLPVGGILSVFILASGIDLDAALAGLLVCSLGLVAGLFFDARSPLRARRDRTGKGTA